MIVQEPLVLVVDDEADIRELLRMTLARMQLNCFSAETLDEAQQLLEQHPFFLCLTDLRLPDGSGIDLVKIIQRCYPKLPVAVITAYGNVEDAVNTLKAGAFDYVSKPINLQILKGLVNTALQLVDHVESPQIACRLLGESQTIKDLHIIIKKLARSQAPVYINGGLGTGKELVARMIHDSSARADKPFIAVDCGAIPAKRMESEFFGHKRGSFRGAVNDKKGFFQAAQGGTLLLDEVADLPLHMQVKLLRAIQEKAIHPVGEQHEVPVDVRILTASHKDLQRLIATGSFRQDLFYRINVIEVTVPNLSERSEDIPLLAETILERLAKAQAVTKPALSTNSVTALQAYDFPGNVRELENILERAMALCENHRIHAGDLQLPVRQQSTSTAAISPAIPLNDYLGEKEKEVILSALEKTKWNRTAAAKQLGVSLRALRYRLKKLDLD